MSALLAALCLWASPVLAKPAAPPAPDEPPAVFSPAVKLKDEPVDYAQAISLTFGATFFAEVHVSTAGAVMDLSRLAHDGFYKRELVELLLMSAKSGKPLAELAARRKKGEALRAMAASLKLDYDALYGAALAIEKTVDEDYLPRFPERRSRPERKGGDYWYQP
jgi:hypothetical protein